MMASSSGLTSWTVFFFFLSISSIASGGRLDEDWKTLEQMRDPTEWDDNVFSSSNDADDGPSYSSTRVCGRNLVCQNGARGPCRPNEIFTQRSNVSSPSFFPHRPVCWNNNRISTSVSRYGCQQQTSSQHVSGSWAASRPSIPRRGCCALRDPQRPCTGYPGNYRFCQQMKRCYPCSIESFLGSSSGSAHCGANKIFADLDGRNGICRCRDRNQLSCKSDGNQCHRIYSRGPCGAGQWVAPDRINKGQGVCRPSPCPSEQCDGRHIFWRPNPAAPGGCFRSFSRGPCRSGYYFLIEDYYKNKGRCVPIFGSSFYGSSSSGSQQQVDSLWSNFGMFPPLDFFDY